MPLNDNSFEYQFKRREVKGKDEKERCTHLNVEFQRIARRHKKAFLSDQCKDLEISSRKLDIPKEHFCKSGHNKGQKHYGSNRSREYEEVARIHRRTIQKRSHDPDNHDGMIAHLEPDILKCEVKWALGSITTNKASGGDGIPMELFQILKADAV